MSNLTGTSSEENTPLGKGVCFQTCQFVLNEAGHIIQCDDHTADRIGIPKETLIGQPLRQILVSLAPSWDKLLPADLRIGEPLFLPWEAENNPFGAGVSLSHIAHQGLSYLTLSPDLAPQEELREAPVTDFQPQSEIIAQMFLRLQLSESRLSGYMENFPGIFFCQRPDLSFTYIGPKLETTLGMPMQILYRNGGAFLERIDENDRQHFLREIDRNSARAKTFSFSYRLRHAQDRSVIYFMDVRTPLFTPAGLLLGYEGVWLDVSRQSIAENRLTSTAWKENLATITSGLVHDFSNIMAGIHSLSELYHDMLEQDNPMYEGLTQIKKSSMQAQKLVRRIIDLNREETGQRDYHNLENLIRDQLDIIRVVLPKHTDLKTQFTEEEIPVYLDEVSFRRMLLNLAINARDALPTEGDSQVSISVTKIPMGSNGLTGCSNGPYITDRDSVELTFKDNGCGIQQAHLKKIFAPFFTTKEATKGSGFGLYNARLFVEQCKGKIGVNSTPDEGTSFHILLPLADFTEMQEEAEAKKRGPSLSYQRRPSFAIYAQTDPTSFQLVNTLRQQEYEVICFTEHDKLTDYLKDAEFPPHLLLTIDIGHDEQIEGLIDTMEIDYPGIKKALLILGRNPDETSPSMRKKVELLFSEATMEKDIIRQLEELVS